jgi:HTH-type transcriptional regulator / antitoxin HipB
VKAIFKVFFTERLNIIGVAMSKEINYGVVRSPAELGELARAHRKSGKITLERISGLGNVSIKFLSEFENGKATCEIGKVLQALRTMGLEVVIQPRQSTHIFSVSYPATHPIVSSIHSRITKETGEGDADD